MILQMSASNFRSIDDEQVLDLYTEGTQGGHCENVACFEGIPYHGLKTVGIYGANGSGKSNVLRVLDVLITLVRYSYRFQEGADIDLYNPCVFHSDRDSATAIEIHFTLPYGGTEKHFIYRIAFDATAIISEVLSYKSSTKRPVRLFSRNQKAEIKYGDYIKGRKQKIPVFKNQLFLSVAGGRADAPEIIRVISRYLQKRIVYVTPDAFASFSVDDAIVELMRALQFIDIGASSVRREKETILDVIRRHSRGRHLSDDVVNRLKEGGDETHVLKVAHTDDSGEVRELDIDDESDGTRRFASFLPGLANALIHGGVVLFDEIEAKMHPFLAETIIKLFNDPRINHGQAQLIYTTHCCNLLSQEILRRDQIWFTEKTNCRTVLYSLDDFDKRIVTPTSPYVRWYLDGRFGGIPTIDYGALVTHIQALQSEDVRDE